MSPSNDTLTHAATGDAPSLRPTPRSSGFSRGDLVGRYLVVDRLGAGAMGVVYAAYDPELDRKIALKLLHPASSATVGSEASGQNDALRLRREAQALAKLSHPAVVAVYDVGAIEGQVFIAMEYVEGLTLGAWATAAPRSFREIVAVMLEAGRGLAAAHAAGLLHRDFKPDNVMIEAVATGARTHGRVRVMDFGLARTKIASSTEKTESSAAGLDATREGAIVGTPAYMPPEQLAGIDVDARADQFAFAVTLWELLFGVRPFQGASLAELAANVIDGRFATPPRRAVPSWLRKVVTRGLAAAAADRFPTMDAMLAALARDPTRLRRRAAVIVGAGALALGGVAWQRIAHDRRLAACDGEAATSSPWNDQRRNDVRIALSTSGSARADVTWEKLAPRIDAYDRQWRALASEVCRGEVTEGRSDSRTRARACLDDRRLGFVAVVDGLVGIGADSVPWAVTWVARIPRVESCADEQWLAQRTPPPDDPAVAARVAELDARMFESLARQELGEYDRAHAVASEALEGARALDWKPALARAEVRMGMIEGLVGNRQAKVGLLRSAYFTGGAIGADDEAFDAANALVFAEGYELGNAPAGLEWGRHAEMILDRIGEPDDSRRRADLATLLGVVHDNLREFDAALDLHLRALAIREKMLGGEHPDVAVSLGNIGLAYFGRGEYQAATDFLTRALALYERVHGPAHPTTTGTLNNLGMAEMAMGASDLALGHFERAVALIERDLGADHPDLAAGLNNLGVLLRLAERPTEARRHFERAAAIWRRSTGNDPSDLALALDNLGIVARTLGELDDALAQHRAALALRERVLGPDHHDVASSLEGIGRVALARGQAGDAVAPLERSLAIFAREPNPEELGNVRFALARALVDRDRGRARELAAQALEELRRAGAEAGQAEVTAWLSTHE